VPAASVFHHSTHSPALKKYLFLAAKIVVSLSLLGYLLWQLDWPSLIEKAGGIAAHTLSVFQHMAVIPPLPGCDAV
jgi:hypothetical protein